MIFNSVSCDDPYVRSAIPTFFWQEMMYTLFVCFNNLASMQILRVVLPGDFPLTKLEMSCLAFVMAAFVWWRFRIAVVVGVDRISLLFLEIVSFFLKQ